MKKTYIISFLVIFLLIIVSYFGSYYFMREKVKEVPMEKKEDVLKANSGTKMFTSDQTVYVLEKYDAATYELTEEKMTMPAEYVGLTREELMEQCSQRIVVNCDKPQQAVTVLDKMGITKYQVTDKTHVSIFERLEDSGLINQRLMQENILVNEIAVAGEELESYYLRVTGGMDHV